ncbi:MAG: polysaccharide pyruvyl transferase family protein, partial [Victivallales bacterium]|nr:polysaccharide pyruvyl transferase family protein [Victivallales bacterium]
ADTAIHQTASPVPPFPVIAGVRRIGFCISAQRELTQKKQLLELWERLLLLPDTRLVLIPMNPLTDKALMCRLASELPRKKSIELLESSDPAVVQACAAQCRVVVSSRLHLLILASNANVPVIGIERGSKIRNWLRNFNDTPAGTVANCDFEEIYRRILDILSCDATLRSNAIASQMQHLHSRLGCAAHILQTALNPTIKT